MTATATQILRYTKTHGGSRGRTRWVLWLTLDGQHSIAADVTAGNGSVHWFTR